MRTETLTATATLLLWFASILFTIVAMMYIESRNINKTPNINFADGRWTAKVWQETDWSKPPLVDVEIGLRSDGVLCWRQAGTVIIRAPQADGVDRGWRPARTNQ